MPHSSDRTGTELARTLRGMDGSGYGRYKSLSGRWQFEGFTIHVDRVQADPFAPPSRLRIQLAPDESGIPPDTYSNPVRTRALADYLVRQLARRLAGTKFRVDAGGQVVIARSACEISDGHLTMRIGLELPGHGRRIDGHGAHHQLCVALPEAVRSALLWEALDEKEARAFVDSVEDTDTLRHQLAHRDLVAFVADGAILPRASGVDQRPMPAGAVPFATPESLRVTLDAPHAGPVTGMGIRSGVTLVVGGGFHGKSTLLQALERGVYDHIPGDGREFVVTRSDAVKIRAEEGRRVERVDVGAFVSQLPTGTDTTDFRSDNASGSTSQAAAVAEALEAGAGVLLVDEDTAATNLMIRDARMQRLVAPDKEPLTPFVDLVRPLARDHGVSTVLVMGGCGDYFDVADRVVMMDAYHARDVTDAARGLATDRTDAHFPPLRHRVVEPRSVSPYARGKRKIARRGHDALTFGADSIDLRALEQLVDPSQITGIGLALAHAGNAKHLDGERTLAAVLDRLDAELESNGVSTLADGYAGDFALPRRFEIVAAINRLRTLRVTRLQGPTS